MKGTVPQTASSSSGRTWLPSKVAVLVASMPSLFNSAFISARASWRVKLSEPQKT